MEKVKIVVIGAGSASFGRGTIADILSCAELNQGTELSVVLVDTDEQALDTMHGFAGVLKQHHGATASIEATTDRLDALPGANFVITAVARDRAKLWDQDFQIPLAFGFRHPYGENGGPGAAFHTLRSLHLMMPIAQDMERLCPDALMLNFTNPESRVCLGVTRLTSVPAVGLCHGAFGTQRTVAQVLGRPEDEVEMTVGGINHFHFVLGLREVRSGKDLLPAFQRGMAEGDHGIEPLTRYLYDTFGLLPFSSDSHISEYVGAGYSFLGPHYLEYTANWRYRDDAMGQIERIARGETPLTDGMASGAGELAIPIICDIVFDRGERQVAANVPNDNFAVSNLPEDAIVEVPVVVDARGVHAVPVGALPEGIAAMCRLQISIQNLLVEAYRERSKRLLLQALLLEPTVDDAKRAEQMIETMLQMQMDYLKEMA